MASQETLVKPKFLSNDHKARLWMTKKTTQAQCVSVQVRETHQKKKTVDIVSTQSHRPLVLRLTCFHFAVGIVSSGFSLLFLHFPMFCYHFCFQKTFFRIFFSQTKKSENHNVGGQADCRSSSRTGLSKFRFQTGRSSCLASGSSLGFLGFSTFQHLPRPDGRTGLGSRRSTARRTWLLSFRRRWCGDDQFSVLSAKGRRSPARFILCVSKSSVCLIESFHLRPDSARHSM